MGQIQRSADYLKHVVEDHGGRWQVKDRSVNGEPAWMAQYDHPDSDYHSAYIARTADDATVCLAFGLHQKLSRCGDCWDLKRLMGR